MHNDVTSAETPLAATSRAVSTSVWHDVGDVVAVIKARRTVFIAPDDHQIVVIVHDGALYALDNICIHKQRELHRGVVLHDRLVCPGHQWAFDLACGWEAVKQQCQPTYAVRITDDERVEVDLASRAVRIEPPER